MFAHRVLYCQIAILAAGLAAASEPIDQDKLLREYFRAETAALRDACLADIHNKTDWEAKRPELRRQLLEMLGLDPLPEKTDLKATVTGRVERDEFLVENIHFQSRPNLYVTGNLYLPKNIDKPVPAILYVCGHGGVKENGISYGNKVHYQHHGAWFARNGYACLTIDSLQLGEIEGIHHGTYDHDMWWWLCRGYTPAGVEAWNCVRALDYLETRPEIDASRMGVTGRSGGGAYSWWIAAIDERIQAAVPVAGITDLQNHVVDGCVEGHCDCMYMVNTFRWDYPQVAALVAPRPLLISNTDRDSIFPLDGVERTHMLVRRIYDDIYKQPDALALNITAGPHKDTQELQISAFRWLNHYLKNDDSLIEKTAVPFFTPQELKVFAELPSDAINAKIAETFVPAASPLEVPEDQQQWNEWKAQWMDQLQSKVFSGWPTSYSTKYVTKRLHIREGEEITTQDHVVLPVHIGRVPGDSQQVKHVYIAGDNKEFRNTTAEVSIAVFAPRGIGPAAWSGSEEQLNQIKRRFYLLGQSLDGMQVWDVRQALAALRKESDERLIVHAQGRMAGIALYAALCSDDIEELHLVNPPHSHRDGPYLLNVQRFMDMPHAMALAAERTRVVVYDKQPEAWQTVVAIRDKLGWPANHFELRDLPTNDELPSIDPDTP